MHRLRKITVCAIALLVASAMFAPAASAIGRGPIFNNPKGSHDAKYRLQMRVEKAIRATPRGGTILIATFLLDREQSADALIAARNRGVNVRVVMDGAINTRHSRRLRNVLNRDNGRNGQQWGPDDSFAVFCNGACRGGGFKKNMHSKFYAFSRTGGTNDVIMVSSANLNRGGALLGWNDLYTMTRVDSMYQTYRRIHDEMARDRKVDRPYVVKRQGPFESQFFPKKTGGRAGDPIYQALQRVRCHGTKGGAGAGGRTKINVSMFFWGKKRGNYIATKLLNLDRSGCLVSVIYGAPTNQLAARLRRSAWRGGINLYDSRKDRNGNGMVDLRVHTKYMLIGGKFAGDASSWQVFTGSPNWVDGSLRGGDEVTLQISGRKAHAKYMRNWNYVRAHGTRKIGR